MGAVTIQWSVLETAALRHPPANPNWQGLARSGSAGRLAHERTPTPHRQRAAAPAAEDPTGRAGPLGGPGDPRPFGATRKAGLSSAECVGTVDRPHPDAGVVHHHVHPAEPVRHLGGRLFHRPGVAHVGREGQGGEAPRAAVGDGSVETGPGTAGEGHRRPLGEEGVGHRLAETARRPRHHHPDPSSCIAATVVAGREAGCSPAARRKADLPRRARRPPAGSIVVGG